MYEIISTVVKFFPLQLLIAELLFAGYLKKRSMFAVRLAVPTAVYLVASYFIPWDLFAIFGWFSFKYIILLAATVGIMFAAFDASYKEILFCTTAGYAVEHIAFSFMMIAYRAYGGANGSNEWIKLTIYFLSFVFVYVLGWLFFARRIKRGSFVNMQNGKLIATAAVIVVITQGLSLWLNHSFPGVIICRVYAVFCSVLALLVQFNFFRESDLQHKNELLEQLLRKEREQYEISKENIDLINMKCHDIKKNLSMLLELGRGESARTITEESLGIVNIYDSALKTGSEALDILLMDKGLRCRNENIKMSCMADGAAFSFMEPSDIFSLIGNALDNAIECVRQENCDNRVILFKTARRGEQLYVHIENSCLVPPVFRNGLPQTTKSDKRMHGFGLRSISYIAEKYKGNVRMYYEDGMFNLDVLFPDAYAASA
ncbi:MAG: GHKL domain-containing protein [Clostridia bacterium]|nr:GHKL domain-containing protein [Clostridia bacterium]